MAYDANHQQPPTGPSLTEKLLAVGKPSFSVFAERRRAGVPPPEMDSAPDALAIPGDPKDISTMNLLPERAAAMSILTIIQHPGDFALARVPSWIGNGATSCGFPRQVQDSMPKVEYQPILRSEASCLCVTDVRGKGKGCVAARAVPRGELVARERALLLIPRIFVISDHAVNVVVTMMTPTERAAFFALHNCKSTDPNDALGIVRTNSFLVPGMPSHNIFYSAVFEKFSRFNHRYARDPLFPVLK